MSVPEITPKAFLSCSFAKDDQPVVAFFRDFISAFRINLEVYDRQEVERLTDQIKKHISASDCVIAVATRAQKIESSDEYTCSDWITQEIAFASAYGKPVALFLEDGVRLSGFVPADIRREKFARTNLLDNVHKIAAFLFNLRVSLDSNNPFAQLKPLTVLRHFVRVEEQMFEGHMTQFCDVLMESLVERLPAIAHSTTVDHSGPGLSVKAEAVQVQCLEKPANTNVTTATSYESDQRRVWTLSFDPPLKKGDRVRYQYRIKRAHDVPYTYERLLELITNKVYRFPDPRCRVGNWIVNQTTNELSIRVEFPRLYEVEGAEIDVTVGEAFFRAEEENKRIVDNGWLKVQRGYDSWVMDLRVYNPLYGHRYAVAYKPPTRDSLKPSSGFKRPADPD